MPEISRFYGIVVKIFHNDHHPPHFHAEYGGEQMLVAIDTLAILAGRLPPRATGFSHGVGNGTSRRVAAYLEPSS